LIRVVNSNDVKPYQATVDVTTVEYQSGCWGIPKASVVVRFRCSVTGHTLCWPETITFATQLEAGRYAYASAMSWVDSRYA